MKAQGVWLGFGLVLLAAAGFAANTTAAVVSYQGGAAPLSVATVRLSFAVFALYAFIRLTGGTVRLPARDRNLALLYGFISGTQSYGLLQSIEYIPVGLGVLTFYLYPLFTGVLSHLIGREHLGWRVAGALIVAFAGLALALDVTGRGVDPLGVAIAAMSALVLSIVVLLTVPLMARVGDSRPVNFYMHFSAAPAFIVLCIAMGDFPLPRTETGWVGFLAVPLFYAVGTTAFYAAVKRIGPVRAGIFMNAEPLCSIALGFIVLGQVLSATQLIGAAFVVFAIVVVTRERARPGGRAARPRA